MVRAPKALLAALALLFPLRAWGEAPRWRAYLLGSWGQLRASELAPVTISGVHDQTPYSATVVPRNSAPGASAIGAGVRYNVPRASWLMLDAAYLHSIAESRRPTATISGIGNAAEGIGGSQGLEIHGLRFSGNLRRKLSSSVTGYGGLGLLYSNVRQAAKSPRLDWTFPVGPNLAVLHMFATDESESVSLLNPFVRAGVEWRPRARFGCALFGQLNVGPMDYTHAVTVQVQHTNGDGAIFDTRTVPVYKVSLPRATIEANVSIYF